MQGEQQSTESSWSIRLLASSFVIIVSICLSSVFLAAGKIGVEKTLTTLAMPVGILWLLIGSAFCTALVKKRSSAIAFGSVFLAFSLVSCQPFIDWLTGLTENSVKVFVPSKQSRPLDVVVVLGGGTRLGPHRPEVSGAGDRVVYAAELYQMGLAKHLITTGETIGKPDADLEGRIGPAAETIVIWEKLGIPHESITTLQGRTTFEEMGNLKTWINQQPDSNQMRIGLLTSAMHLPRALRLAKARGLEGLYPLAANFRSNPNAVMLIDFFPRASALSQFADLQKEWMAWMVGR